MKPLLRTRNVLILALGIVVAGLWMMPASVSAQEEVASALRRYKESEVSTGYYEEYEVRPRHQRAGEHELTHRRGIERQYAAQQNERKQIRRHPTSALNWTLCASGRSRAEIFTPSAARASRSSRSSGARWR